MRCLPPILKIIKEKKLYIFDLDGTLVNSFVAIQKSLNYTLEKLGYSPVSYTLVKRSVGNGDKLFISTFFPKELHEKALETFRLHHKQSVIRYSKLLPSARKLLYQLKRRKKILAIATNRPRHFTDIILDKLDIKKYFDYILSADEIKSLKPDPRILRTVMNRFRVSGDDTVFVGDMDIDLETAMRASVDAVFIKGGSSFLRDIKKYTNKKIVSSLDEIVGLFE